MNIFIKKIFPLFALSIFTLSPFISILFFTYILAQVRFSYSEYKALEWLYLSPRIIIGISSLTPLIIAVFTPSNKRYFLMIVAFVLMLSTWITGWFFYVLGACLGGYCI